MSTSQGLLIDGKWKGGDGTFAVTNPYDGQHLADVAVATEEHVKEAVRAATVAMGREDPPPLADILSRASDLMHERREEFASTICAEAGKPISAARTEVDRAVTTIRLSSEEARRIHGETVPLSPIGSRSAVAFTQPRPLGVVAAVTPFNFPANLVAHKVGPALAAGCAVVLKPSERTPLTAGLIAQALLDAGLPGGWLNIVTGDPAVIVPAMTHHPDVALLTFTGSAEIGWKIKAASPRKHHVLELGSNTAMVVAPDADPDRVVDAVVTGGFTFSGQACISVQRVYAHRDIVDSIAARLASAVDALAVGDPADDETVVGPLISHAARDRVLAWIDEAVAGGATVLAGGAADGAIVRPTVLRDAPDSSHAVCDEVFGPVVVLQSCDDMHEAMARANRSRYGLNTAIFTRDIALALRYAEVAQAGAVMVNVSPSFRADHMPYGGVKDSGQGREGVRYAVDAMTQPRLVIISE